MCSYKSDTDGLIACVRKALQVQGVYKPILMGGGTDGTTVNISEQNGMKGKLQCQLPWLVLTCMVL